MDISKFLCYDLDFQFVKISNSIVNWYERRFSPYLSSFVSWSLYVTALVELDKTIYLATQNQLREIRIKCAISGTK